MVQQGLADPVVPFETTRGAVQDLKREGVDVVYFEYAGQGHGFKDPTCADQALARELSFMGL